MSTNIAVSLDSGECGRCVVKRLSACKRSTCSCHLFRRLSPTFLDMRLCFDLAGANVWKIPCPSAATIPLLRCKLLGSGSMIDKLLDEGSDVEFGVEFRTTSSNGTNGCITGAMRDLPYLVIWLGSCMTNAKPWLCGYG